MEVLSGILNELFSYLLDKNMEFDRKFNGLVGKIYGVALDPNQWYLAFKYIQNILKSQTIVMGVNARHLPRHSFLFDLLWLR